MKNSFLVNLIEDTRNAVITKMRGVLSRDDLSKVTISTRTLVDVAKHASDTARKDGDNEPDEIDLAVYLQGQYEEAVIFLSSMIQE